MGEESIGEVPTFPLLELEGGEKEREGERERGREEERV